MNDVIEQLESQFDEVEEMGSKWHSYLQLNIGGYFRYKLRDKYVAFSELSLELTIPYIQPNGKESFIVKPDIAIYELDEKPLRHRDELTISKMPICAIEILSPRQSFSELLDKAECYFANGIQSYWIIMPRVETIFVFNKNIDNQNSYGIKDKLIDNILKIELLVSEIFE